ncbi:hypothetical protein Tbd_1788 [Thiobacillus denitrificans ATCC 25259]|uniref:Type I phosphodiesterase/nucleotide pyrophosphatase n=1 Tax=Thiobacillus denitrificans (strain ATCC 25259 / T1) TaxID=292415 RepID=Q3SHZ2_THIDA|nr:hypothetical protein Tbd_1788 [Thiobacillus denitrificans ATCC 25259]
MDRGYWVNEKMRLLVIGIDGADRRVVDGMPMPFLQRLLADGTHYFAEVDLFSRGWAEIFTGKHGIDTGAFYNRPACTGRYEFTQHFNLNSLDANRTVRPIWQDLNDKGFRVGVMNIPTTLPAPPVEGFFVAGAGGGEREKRQQFHPPGGLLPAGDNANSGIPRLYRRCSKGCERNNRFGKFFPDYKSHGGKTHGKLYSARPGT